MQLVKRMHNSTSQLSKESPTHDDTSESTKSESADEDSDPELTLLPLLGSSSKRSSEHDDSTNNKSARHRWKRVRLFLIFALLLVLTRCFIAVVGLPFPNKSLPKLAPLPSNPKRAYATLHTGSSPCYDMMLHVAVQTWLDTNSKYPLLLMHSVPLPDKVESLVQHHPDRLLPKKIPFLENPFAFKRRIRSCAAKLAVWDQTDFDQLMYYDSDMVYYENGDGIFDATQDGSGDKYLYNYPYQKYWDMGLKWFNAGSFLVRPSHAMYKKLLDLFQRRFWVFSGRVSDFIKGADQRFLNYVLHYDRGDWGFLAKDAPGMGRIRHVKFWLALQGLGGVSETEQVAAQELAERLQLQEDLEQCRLEREKQTW